MRSRRYSSRIQGVGAEIVFSPPSSSGRGGRFRGRRGREGRGGRTPRSRRRRRGVDALCFPLIDSIRSVHGTLVSPPAGIWHFDELARRDGVCICPLARPPALLHHRARVRSCFHYPQRSSLCVYALVSLRSHASRRPASDQRINSARSHFQSRRIGHRLNSLDRKPFASGDRRFKRLEIKICFHFFSFDRSTLILSRRKNRIVVVFDVIVVAGD